MRLNLKTKEHMVDDVEKRTEYFFIITTIVKFDQKKKVVRTL